MSFSYQDNQVTRNGGLLCLEKQQLSTQKIRLT